MLVIPCFFVNMITFQKEPYADEETYSVLCPLVRSWFSGKFAGFAAPQKYAIVNIHRRQNTLVSAPTGSGKTLTAFLSVLNELIMLSGAESWRIRFTVFMFLL